VRELIPPPTAPSLPHLLIHHNSWAAILVFARCHPTSRELDLLGSRARGRTGAPVGYPGPVSLRVLASEALQFVFGSLHALLRLFKRHLHCPSEFGVADGDRTLEPRLQNAPGELPGLLFGPRLYSRVGAGRARLFLALLLFASSQEPVRGPPYRIGDPAYRIGDPA
jgi:hypothetical protein